MSSCLRRSPRKAPSCVLSATTPAPASAATGKPKDYTSPYMRVYLTEESLKHWDGGALKGSDEDIYLGKVHDPWHCCNLTMEIFDEDNNKNYYISGSCCQCGLYCHWPCGPCERVVFKIFDMDNNEVGSIEKIWSSCVKELFSDADNFIANFPASSTWKQKALLLGATLMIDFRFFEKQKKNNNNQGGFAA